MKLAEVYANRSLDALVTISRTAAKRLRRQDADAFTLASSLRTREAYEANCAERSAVRDVLTERCQPDIADALQAEHVALQAIAYAKYWGYPQRLPALRMQLAEARRVIRDEIDDATDND